MCEVRLLELNYKVTQFTDWSTMRATRNRTFEDMW